MAAVAFCAAMSVAPSTRGDGGGAWAVPPGNEGGAFRNIVLPILVVLLPLALILGTIARYFGALLASLRTTGKAVGKGAEPTSQARRRLSIYGALVAGALAFGLSQNAPSWGMQNDEERDFIIATVCASGKACPLFGNEMNQLRVKLPPTNRYLMSACNVASPDPRVVLVVLLVLQALAVGVVAALGDALLGFPFGVVAAVILATNGPLLDVEQAASNGAWGAFFIAVGLWGTLTWIRSGAALPFVVAVTGIGIAGSVHGSYLLLWPCFVLAALLCRPQVPARAVAGGAAALGLIYAPWIWYQAETQLADFDVVSTAWMVQGASSGVLSRMARIFDVLGSPAVFPAGLRPLLVGLACGGAFALWRSRAAAEERLPGRALVVFIVVPMVPMFFAGASWNPRYGVVVAPAVALATAGGARAVWSFLKRTRALAFGLPHAGAAAVFAGFALWTGYELSSGTVRRPGRGSVVDRTLAEQREAITAVGEHGFRAQDLERSVHGLPWRRWSSGTVYLGHWLIGTRGEAPREHVLVAEQCKGSLAGFARWETALQTSGDARRVLIGYQPELASPTLTVEGSEGRAWSGNLVPFYGQLVHSWDNGLRRRLDPALAPTADVDQLLLQWNRPGARVVRLRSALAAGTADRTVTVSYDAGLRVSVMIAGVARSLGADSSEMVFDTVRERYRIRASERTAAVPIEVTIDFDGKPLPRRIDIYEEPGESCR